MLEFKSVTRFKGSRVRKVETLSPRSAFQGWKFGYSNAPINYTAVDGALFENFLKLTTILLNLTV